MLLHEASFEGPTISLLLGVPGFSLEGLHEASFGGFRMRKLLLGVPE